MRFVELVMKPLPEACEELAKALVYTGAERDVAPQLLRDLHLTANICTRSNVEVCQFLLSLTSAHHGAALT